MKLRVEEPEGGFFGSDVQDPRLVTTSEELEGESSGENLALDSTREGRAFVLQPDLDHVQVMQTDDLLDVCTFDAGPSSSPRAEGRVRSCLPLSPCRAASPSVRRAFSSP